MSISSEQTSPPERVDNPDQVTVFMNEFHSALLGRDEVNAYFAESTGILPSPAGRVEPIDYIDVKTHDSIFRIKWAEERRRIESNNAQTEKSYPTYLIEVFPNGAIDLDDNNAPVVIKLVAAAHIIGGEEFAIVEIGRLVTDRESERREYNIGCALPGWDKALLAQIMTDTKSILAPLLTPPNSYQPQPTG